MNTKHAAVRCQQRGIPPLIDELLDRYGHEQYQGDGFVKIYMDKTSRRKMERDLGRRILIKLSDWFHIYKVITTDGKTITIGHLTQRIQRV